MTKRRPIRRAPPVIEDFASKMDRVFARADHAEAFRDYLTGLDLPPDMPKHLPGITAALPDTRYESLRQLLTRSAVSFDTLNATRIQLLLPWLHNGGVLVIGNLYAAFGQHPADGSPPTERLIGMVSCWADDAFSVPLDVMLLDDPSSTTTDSARADLALELVQRAHAQVVPFSMVVRAHDNIATGRMLATYLAASRTPYLLALTHAALLATDTPDQRLVDSLVAAAHERPRDGWCPALYPSPGGLTKWFVGDLSELAPALGTPHLLVATADPRTLPQDHTLWLRTNVPPALSRRTRRMSDEVDAPVDPHLAYFLQHDVVDRFIADATQHYGWNAYHGRAPASRRHHWLLVCCVFTAHLLARLSAAEPDTSESGTADAAWVRPERVVVSHTVTRADLVELLRRTFGVPMKLAGSYAHRLLAVPAVHAVSTHWLAKPARVPDVTVRGYRLHALVRDHGLTPLHALLLLAGPNPEQALAEHRAQLDALATATPEARFRMYEANDVTLVPLHTQYATHGTPHEVEANPAVVLHQATPATLAELLASAQHHRLLHEVDRLNQRFLQRLGQPMPSLDDPDPVEPVLYVADDWRATGAVRHGYHRWTMRWYRVRNQPLVELVLEERDVQYPWHHLPESHARTLARHLLHAPATPALVADWVLAGVQVLRSVGVSVL